MGQGEGLNLRQRERRLCLREGVAPVEGEVIIWWQDDVTSFEVMTWVIILYAKEAPRADPHAGCCGGWGLETPGYPIMHPFYPVNIGRFY